jgi:uncharacterized membrane protein
MLNDYAGMLAAPFFLIISGISYNFFMKSRSKKRTTEIFIESVSRSVFIYTLPLIPYIVASLAFPERFPFHLIHWGVFQVIAVGYILGFFLHKNLWRIVLAVMIVLSLTIVIQGFPPCQFDLFFTDFTPVFPWIAYFFLGQLVFRVYDTDWFSSSRLFIIATVALIASALLFNAAQIPFDYYSRNEIPVVIFIASMVFFIQSALIVLVDREHRFGRVSHPLESTGRIAFSAYYIQFPLIFGFGLIIMTLGLPPVTIVPSVILIIVILALIERLWEPWSYRYGFEWMIRSGSEYLSQWFAKRLRHGGETRE